MQRSMEQDFYLGLPILFGRGKAKEFRNIKERLGARIQQWSGRLLSQAGRVVMIQAISQALPLYAMSYFKFPRDFFHELNMMLLGFWWGDMGSIKGTLEEMGQVMLFIVGWWIRL